MTIQMKYKRLSELAEDMVYEQKGDESHEAMKLRLLTNPAITPDVQLGALLRIACALERLEKKLTPILNDLNRARKKRRKA